MILLNDDERRQWEAAVATWPTCQTCAHAYDKGSLLTIDAKGFHREPCPDCVAGHIPQPVYIVIEGEPHGHDGNTSGCQVRPGVWQCATDTCTGSFHDEDFHEYGLVVPARWRAAIKNPEHCSTCKGTGRGGTRLDNPPFVPCPDCRGVPVGEPCEIRAECPLDHDGNWTGCSCSVDGSVLLASATVEVLPVVGLNDPHNNIHNRVHVCVGDGDGVAILSRTERDWVLDLDPLPVPGRHFVAAVTP